MALETKNPLANAGNARDVGSVPGLGRSPGGGNGLLNWADSEPFLSSQKVPLDNAAQIA